MTTVVRPVVGHVTTKMNRVKKSRAWLDVSVRPGKSGTGRSASLHLNVQSR